jgi:hypothetical protein
MLEHQPNGSLPHFLGVLLHLCHDPILSRVGVPDNPGAVQVVI